MKNNKLVLKITKRILLAIVIMGLLVVGLVVIASVDWIDDDKHGAAIVVSNSPSPVQSSIPAVINQVQDRQIPTTTINAGLSLEDRQRLGKERGDLEELIRKGEEAKQKLNSSLDTLLNQCKKASSYDKQCWDDYYKFQDEVNQKVSEIDGYRAKASSRISEINALLGN